MNKELEVISLGCRLNTFESEIIRSIACCSKKRIVINTCSVTNSAAKQSMRIARNMRNKYPDAELIVTGCAAQLEPLRYAGVADRVIGNSEKLQAKSYAETSYSVTGIADQIVVNDMDLASANNYDNMLVSFKDHTRAFVEIQNGCNHSCTFCTIPMARGKNRSSPASRILAQIRELVNSGCNDITLTGVDISDYGIDIGSKLSSLVAAILREIPDLPRLRLSSLDVAEVTNDLIRIFGEESRLMPHIHLSLQSGDDLILKRMRRRHNRSQIMAFCDIMRAIRPEIVFGADIIAGFPTENEEMFTNTIDILKQAGISLLHVFSFSPNRGAPASRMPQVPRNIIKSRAQTLRQLASEIKTKLLDSLIGSTQKILLENNGHGKTEHYLDVIVIQQNEQEMHAGEIYTCKIVGLRGGSLVGQLN